MTGFTRRRFLQYGAGVGAALAIPWPPASAAIAASIGGKLAKYLERLPVTGNGLVVATASGPNQYSFTQRQISKQLHPQLPPTPLWAYDDGSGLAGQAGLFGMVVVAQTGTPVQASFTHAVGDTYPAWIPVDTRFTAFGNQVRLLTHLHGGFVSGDSDGNPGATPNGFGAGEAQTALYPNQAPQQAASLLWFHDHAPGLTRLNILGGLAAAYLIRDQLDTGTEPNPIGLPGGAYEIPLVFQDRQFNHDGTFLYPVSTIPGATWIGEYFGDVMLVNGKVWPFLEVEPRLYRFRILNACNARILNLGIGGAQVWQIGGDGGLFDAPVPVKQLVLAPAERADVVVDFRRNAGLNLVMKNNAPPPPVVTPAPSLTTTMQFRVGTSISQPGPSRVPASLPGIIPNLPAPPTTRYITLNEVNIDTADWVLNLNGLDFTDPATETPAAGTVEDWVYVNLTGDTHPLHPHLVGHQVIGRTPFDVNAYVAAVGAGPNGVPGGTDPTPFATGPMQPPPPEERGFKDTTKVNPGYFTTIRLRFALPSGVTAPQTYVHHCHILEHEDNDMMRPVIVTS
jgi:spore coat protein A, manganese oxidase